jgi:hypothetical protein
MTGRTLRSAPRHPWSSPFWTSRLMLGIARRFRSARPSGTTAARRWSTTPPHSSPRYRCLARLRSDRKALRAFLALEAGASETSTTGPSSGSSSQRAANPAEVRGAVDACCWRCRCCLQLRGGSFLRTDVRLYVVCTGAVPPPEQGQHSPRHSPIDVVLKPSPPPPRRTASTQVRASPTNATHFTHGFDARKTAA